MLAMIAGAAWYQQSSHASAEDSARSIDDSVNFQPVSVMKVSQSTSAIMPQRYTATVVARRKSSLSFQASERVDEILCDEGDYVEKGELLARQDQDALKAQYDAAVARSKQTAAVLAELEKGPREEIIAAARADLERLKAQSELSNANFRRQTSLRKNNAASLEEYDAAKFNFAASKSAVAAAQQKLDELIAGTRKEQIDAQRAALGVIKATVAQAKTRLDQTELFAPFAGRISARHIDEGSLPQRGAPVLEIVEVDQLEVRFGASPSIASQLQTGQSLTFTSFSKTCTGNIRQISPTLNPSTRTQQVIVTVNAADETSLVDGQTVQIEFAIKSDDSGFWIPTEALQPQVRGLWSVLVAESDKSNSAERQISTANRRDVEILATWGTWSRVRGTLMDNDQVIVQGANRLANGQSVSATPIEVEFPWQDSSTIDLENVALERN